MTLTQGGPSLTAARRVHVPVSWASRPGESLRQAKWTELGGEVDPQIKIKAAAIRNGNGCQIVKQQMPNAKEGGDFILSFYSP